MPGLGQKCKRPQIFPCLLETFHSKSIHCSEVGIILTTKIVTLFVMLENGRSSACFAEGGASRWRDPAVD
jgi:hypothetical protein